MSKLNVLKTHKLYIGGSFPRTESGRYFIQHDLQGKKPLANLCLSSRKDFRNAVVAARSAFAGWSGKTAFNRSQILYRMAEMLDGREAQFIADLCQLGLSTAQAGNEFSRSVDLIVHYAGWCDKYQQISGTVNPVSSSHFNFSVPEPTGVVAIITSPKGLLYSVLNCIIPVITGGNTCVVLFEGASAMLAAPLSEVLHCSDLPGGVVNILTGYRKELQSHFASHMDVNALLVSDAEQDEKIAIETKAAANVKRVFYNQSREENESLKSIMQFQEIKTTWHPIENIGPGGTKY